MRILLNRRPLYDQPWGGGNLFLQAFCDAAKRKGHDVVHSFDDDLDLIFMHDPRPSELGIGAERISRFLEDHRWVKVIHRVNECDARKGTNDVDDLLRTSSCIVDVTVFVSKWVKDYHAWVPGYAGGRHHVIHNGVNYDHFHPRQRVLGPTTRIVAHHWSNNRMKGFDEYEAIDRFVSEEKSFMFTYIGRENGTFSDTRIVAPCFGETLGWHLGGHDVYVSGSRFDPGPNHILEALACGIPTYVHKDGGGAVEFAGVDHSFGSIDELLTMLRTRRFMKNEFIPDTWETCMDRYFEVMEGM